MKINIDQKPVEKNEEKCLVTYTSGGVLSNVEKPITQNLRYTHLAGLQSRELGQNPSQTLLQTDEKSKIHHPNIDAKMGLSKSLAAFYSVCVWISQNRNLEKS